MLIEDMLAEGSINMLFANDEAGKSVLALQMAIEAASGQPVFGAFETLRQLKVLYIHTERPDREPYGRSKLMSQQVPVVWGNLAIESTLQGYDISKPGDRLKIIEQLKKTKEMFGEIDWVIIDPIYAWTSSDMVSGAEAGGINHLLRVMQKDVCKTITITHHTNRGSKNKETQVREGEDMYGSRFLSANCSSIYHITRGPEAKGATWKCTKDSWSCLIKKFELTYDAMTMISWIDAEYSKMDAETKIKTVLRLYKLQNRTFYFKDLLADSHLSNATCRIQLTIQIEKGVVTVLNPMSKKHLMQVLGTL